jgi:hypothetical protein
MQDDNSPSGRAMIEQAVREAWNHLTGRRVRVPGHWRSGELGIVSLLRRPACEQKDTSIMNRNRKWKMVKDFRYWIVKRDKG